MSRRYIPIAVATAVLAAVALIGYAWPAPEPLLSVKPLPVRVLLPNSSGKVVFDHQKHFAEYKVECQSCHHERERSSPFAAACRSCHAAAEQPDFRARHTASTDQIACVTCHHLDFVGTDQKQAEHEQLGITRPAPAQTEADGSKAALAAAVHMSCATAGCHADLFVEGSGMKNCYTCHNLVSARTTLRDKGWIAVNPAYADCAVCHTEQALEDLVPARMQAFHGSCVKCHESSGRGPFGQESCNQCHTK